LPRPVLATFAMEYPRYMSAEELRAEIEATRHRAEAEEARLQELQAETEQARERLRLRNELREMRGRLAVAEERNTDEIGARGDIDEEDFSEPDQFVPAPQSQHIMQATGGESANFGDMVAKGEYVWRIEEISWVPCYLSARHHGTLAIELETSERIALRYRIYIKAHSGEFVPWGETRDVVHPGGVDGAGWPQVGAYGPDVHWPGHAPASLGIFGLSHEELLHSEWVENGNLTVKFVLEVRPFRPARTQPISLAAEVPEPTMSQDTKALLEEGKCSDIRFVVQDEVIHAHSQVLCARAEVFSKQLTAGMQESVSKVIVIEDCDVATFKTFLQFLYTDHLPDAQPQLSQIQALLAVSHKYQVKRLQLWCEAKLSEHIDTSQISAILCQAHLLQAKQLEKACLAFIRDHPGQVLTLPAYVDLVKKWPQIGLKVHLFSAGVSEAEAQDAIDALEKPQHQGPEQPTQ
ncbi:BPM2, partial [Symbiodinium necroappetens]